jgi:hypothetical protein
LEANTRDGSIIRIIPLICSDIHVSGDFVPSYIVISDRTRVDICTADPESIREDCDNGVQFRASSIEWVAVGVE